MSSLCGMTCRDQPRYSEGSPEDELIHLVELLLSEDFQVLLDLSDQRLAVLQVGCHFPLALHRLAALRP